MKNLVFIAAAFVCIGLSACQKGDKVVPVNGSSFTATIDGTDEVFNLADSVRLNGTSGAFLTGTNAATKDCIRIYLGRSSGTFGAGTYYTPQPGKDNGGQIMFLVAGSETDGYYTYYTEPYETDPGFQYFGTITVSDFNSSLLQGTFSGSLVAFSSVTPGANNPLKTKTITNGKFTIYLHAQP